MRTPPATDRLSAAVGIVRTATAALAVAVALSLLLRVPVVATFRASLLILAALEILAFGRAALSRASWRRPAVELVVKLAILGAAYSALSS